MTEIEEGLKTQLLTYSLYYTYFFVLFLLGSLMFQIARFHSLKKTITFFETQMQLVHIAFSHLSSVSGAQ